MSALRILVAIDDTDDLASPGTGELASAIGALIEARGWGASAFVTRHQLFVHPDIPYTSHNSAMCLAAQVRPQALRALIEAAGRYLETRSAPGSDPGLCVVVPSRLGEPDALVRFGERAKTGIVLQSEAHALARTLGVHLSEHGGSGLGVIGALAGAGLRLGGNDGRLRGALPIPERTERMTVAELLALPGVDAVCDMQGCRLGTQVPVRVAHKVKTVMQRGLAVVPVVADDSGIAPWRTLTIQELKGH